MEKAVKKIYVFGCPRSGTTYVTEWLRATLSTPVEKLSEADLAHPINSENGLIGLASEGAFFVYVSRDPEQIKRSFQAARRIVELGASEVIISPMPEMEGIASNSQERVQQMIDATNRNTLRQIGRIDLIAVSYDNLGVDESAWTLEENLERHRVEFKESISDWHAEHWMKKPVRGGRVSYKIDV